MSTFEKYREECLKRALEKPERVETEHIMLMKLHKYNYNEQYLRYMLGMKTTYSPFKFDDFGKYTNTNTVYRICSILMVIVLLVAFKLKIVYDTFSSFEIVFIIIAVMFGYFSYFNYKPGNKKT